jgi:LysM repeat protein
MPVTDNAADLEQQQSGGLFSGNKKWLIIGGGALLIIVVLYMLKKGGSTTQKGQNTSGNRGAYNQNVVDPATGIPLGSGPDIAALRTYGALGGGAKYNMGATPPRTPGGPVPVWQVGIGGGLVPPYEPVSSAYLHGLPEPQFPVGPSGPPGPGNIGATGANTADITTSSQALTVAGTVPLNKNSLLKDRIYRVKPGDTLSSIATKFGVPGGWPSLYRLNHHAVGGNPDLLQPGTQLQL